VSIPIGPSPDPDPVSAPFAVLAGGVVSLADF